MSHPVKPHRRARTSIAVTTGFLLLTGVLAPVGIARAHASTQTLFEAEASDNVFTGQAVVQDRPGASGDKTVGYIGGGNGKIGVKVDVIDPARTHLIFQYVSGEDRDISVQCNESAAKFLDLNPGPNWSTPQQSEFTCEGLVAGENVITLWNADGPAPDVDAVIVETDPQTLFEAEDSGNNFTGQAVIQDRPGASGDKTVGYIGGGNGKIGVKVSIEAAGDKVLQLQYVSGEDRDIWVQCEGSDKEFLDLAPSADWNTPARQEFSCYLHAGINTITFWNPDGPAPDVDAVILTTDGDDDGNGNGGTTNPGDGTPTTDPYAGDPSAAMPASDPDNTGDWTLINDYTSEFSGSDLDAGFSRFPDEWGWRDEWRWDDDATVVNDGTLQLTQSYDPTDTFNVTPTSWQTTALDVNLQNANSDTVTSYAAHTGKVGLRQTYYNQFGTRTEQKFTGLSAGAYTFSAWAKTQGAVGNVGLVAEGCDGTEDAQTTDIPRDNSRWRQYFLDVTVTAGASCTVGLQSQGKSFSDVALFDDASFSSNATPSTNKLANGDFENVGTTVNKSGGIYMTQPIKYGYFETRAKSGTPFPGTCLAFWLDGREGDYATEMDMVELGEFPGNPSSVDFAKHRWPSQALGPNHQSDGGLFYTAPWDPSADFHTYGFDWAPGVQRWYVDGQLRRETNDPVYDPAEQIMILSLGLRSPYVNNPGAYPHAYDNAKPSEYDYARVWKQQEMAITNDVTGDYESSFVYSDGWSSTDTANGTVHSTTTPGASWSMRFDGDGVTVSAPVGPDQGSAAYSIDGGTPVVIDQRADDEATSTVWQSPVIPRGKHVLTATVVGPEGVAAAAASPHPVGVDSVTVLNSGATPDSTATVVTPDAATADTAQDQYTIPSQTGVEYLIDGTVVAAGTYPLSTSIVVTARATGDYTLDPDATTSWSFDPDSASGHTPGDGSSDNGNSPGGATTPSSGTSPGSATASTAGNDSSALARTGSDIPGGLIALILALMATGSALVYRGRRRTRRS